jgi:hypothetical protein
MPDIKLEVREIPLARTIVDPEVQRRFDPKQAQHLFENWDEAKAGIITVSARDDGTFHVARGQHRRWVYLRQGRENVLAIVLYGMERKAEADNTLGDVSKPLTATDKFRLAVVAERELEVSLSKLLGFHRLEPGSTFFAYGTLRSVARVTRGMVVADDTLYALTQAWGRNKYAVHQNLLAGLGLVFQHREADRARMAIVLGKITVDAFRASADDIFKTAYPPVKVRVAYAEQFVRLYNHNLRGDNRLQHFI